MSYLKRYAAPNSWQLLRKENAYVMRPSPGAHLMEQSMPIGLLLKRLGHASTTKEARLIMLKTEVLVDGRRIKDYKFPVGLMDVVSLLNANEHYRVLIDNKARIILNKVDVKATKTKPCRVLGKRMIVGGKLQLNLSGGRNLLTDKKDIKTGDTVVLDLPSQKISDTLKLEKGAKILLTAGKHAGVIGIVEDIADERIRFSVNDQTEQTLTEYAFVIPEGIISQ